MGHGLIMHRVTIYLTTSVKQILDTEFEKGVTDTSNGRAVRTTITKATGTDHNGREQLAQWST
jgi:hypothetical protein